MREAKIMAGLEHPHIIKIYTTLPQYSAIVMPWYEYPELSLEVMIEDDENDIDLDWLLQFGIYLAEALQYIHSKGVVHRDIKPANILLDAQREPILIDFDIARASNFRTVSRDEDGKSFYVGTARYSAPEQLLPGSIVGPPADIFALGVVLYQALAHQDPFPWGNSAANYPGEALPAPEPTNAIPARLYDILRALLNQKPALRPTAKIVRNQLQEYLRTIAMP